MFLRLIQFFFPVGMVEKITLEGREAFNRQSAQWQRGNLDAVRQQSFESRLIDRAIRKRNRDRIGPKLKGYAIKWTILFSTILFIDFFMLGDMKATSITNAIAGFIGIATYVLSAFIMFGFWLFHLKWKV